MEKFEDGEHESNWHVYAYDKRKAVEKATEQLLREDKSRPSLDDDEAREYEPWMYFWPINFLR